MNISYLEPGVPNLPARSTVIVAGLPSEMSVEIEAIAVRQEGNAR